MCFGIDAKHPRRIARCNKYLNDRRKHVASTVFVVVGQLWYEHLCNLCYGVDANHLRCIARCDIYLAGRREHAVNTVSVVTIQLWSEHL